MSPTSVNPSAANSDAELVHHPGAALLPMKSIHGLVAEVSLDELSAFDQIIVMTGNHGYEIIVTSPGTANVLVRGGTYFPEFTAARLAGSSLGGSWLKMRNVTVGLRLEFTAPCGRAVVTTPVRSIRVVPLDV